MKIVEFLRVSTEDQGSENRGGLPRQREANALTIKKHNLTVVNTISVIDVSGTSVMHAPEMQEMLRVICSDEIGGIVVADLDRLIRLDNFKDFALLQHLKDTHTLIFLPDQVIDLNTQSGFLIGGFQAIISGNELTQIKKRMLAAKEIKRRKGEHPNNLKSLPMGVSYDYLEHRYFYTDQVQKVQLLFKYLVQQGILTYRELERRTGIHHRTIFNLLRNELYIGYRLYTEKRGPEKAVKPNGRQGDRKKVRRSPDEVIRVRVIENPAVDEKMFWRAQEIIREKNRCFHSIRSHPGQRFLYTGFLVCGVCGEKIYSTSGGRNHQKDYYYCRSKNYRLSKIRAGQTCPSHYLQKAEVETTLTSFIGERLARKDYLKRMVQLALSNEGWKDTQAEIDRIRKLIHDTEAKQSRVLDLYADGILPKGALDKKAHGLARDHASLRMRLKSSEDTIHLRDRFKSEDTIGQIVTTLAEFAFWTATQKRAFLQSQLPAISIKREGITGFTLNFCELRIQKGRGSWPPPA
jgi:DNA invertase Pin-like site-specific DNA recombinase